MNTFSGAHPFNPQHLIRPYEESEPNGQPVDDEQRVDLHEEAVEFAASAISLIESGRCPRCGGTFAPGEIPSGSRITDCRCVPVCAECGKREAIVDDLAYVQIWEWATVDDDRGVPTSHAVAREVAAYEAFRDRHPATTGFLVTRTDGDSVLLHDDGVATVKFPDTGGWAKYGYDDTADEDERRR